MKKLLLASVALVSLAACRNDDNSNDSASIVGTWHESKSIVISGKDNKTVLYTSVSDDCEKKSTFEFTNTNKVIVKAYEFYNNACQALDPETLSYTYTSSTGKTVISYPGQTETDTYDTKVSANELQLSSPINDENQDGVADIEVLYFTR